MISDSSEFKVVNWSSSLWKKIWRCNIPPKVKDVVWRACRDVLPTRDQLRRKRVDVEDQCPVCGQFRESVAHILVNCSFAQKCMLSSFSGMAILAQGTFADWLARIGEVTSGDGFKLVCMTVWSIWKHRNSVVWNNKWDSVSVVVNEGSMFLAQWMAAKTQKDDGRVFGHRDGAVCWQKPASGWQKFNVDGAVFSSLGCGGYGWVARGSHGQFISCASGLVQGPCDARLVEAVGIREVLSWIHKKSLSRVLIESDALDVIYSIRSSNLDLSLFGSIILDIKALLKELVDVLVVFVYRSANSIAHLLARASISSPDLSVWEVVPPEFICNALALEA